MKKLFTPVLLLFFALSSINAQNFLRIVNPEWWADEGQPGLIEAASFTVKPQGAYMEIGMYLTFSAANLGYDNSDSLEVVLDFNLPAGSFVTDSWLWMLDDTTIVKADVHEIQYATEIYEDIVDRRKDPSLLYKKEEGGYQLRVYPLPGAKTRKVRITYLSPAIWSDSLVAAWLPTGILESSSAPLNSLQLVTFPDAEWTNPQLIGLDNTNFVSVTDPVLGEILISIIPHSAFSAPLQFAVDSPVSDEPYFVNSLENGEDKFYQLAYFPPPIPAENKARKVVFLFDYQSGTSTLEKADLFYFVKEFILKNMDENDQFNLIFSKQGGPEKLSSGWIPGDMAEMVLDQLSDPLSFHTDLPGLLEEGIQFLSDNGEEGDLFLLVSSDGVSQWYADQEVENIVNQIGEKDIRLHTLNFQNRNYYWEWDWNWILGERIYLTYTNEVFFQQLSTAVAGSYFGIFEGRLSLWESLDLAFSQLEEEDQTFDLYPSGSNGFTYDRYYQTYYGQSGGVNRAILQIGKYVGEFPQEFDYYAFTDTSLIFENHVIEPAQVLQADSLNREMWTGHHIGFLEGQASSDADIQDIIDLSIAERVLSRYTAFLALDLEQGAEPCIGCWDVPFFPLPTEEVEAADAELLVEVSPNPFTEQCMITVNMEGQEGVQEVQIRIFDAYGKQVAGMQQPASQQITFSWDGTGKDGKKLAAGIYFVVCELGGERSVVKVSRL